MQTLTKNYINCGGKMPQCWTIKIPIIMRSTNLKKETNFLEGENSHIFF